MILLLPIFLKSVQVVSTENPVIIPKQEVYSLTHTPYHFYYQDIIESPKFYGETPVYSTEDLIKESGKVNAETKLSVLEWRLNKQGQPVFKLSNNQFVMADKRLLYDSSIVNDFSKRVWLEPGFVVYNSPYDQQELKSTLAAYQEVEADMSIFAEVVNSYISSKRAGFRRIIFPMMIIVFRKYKSCYLRIIKMNSSLFM